MREELTLPPTALEIIGEFEHLHLGGKDVVCPYYMNIIKERAGLRSLIGKGDPSEIEKEVMVWAKLKDFDLNKADASQIRKFMMNHHIGIDCSGFIVHVLNFWLQAEGKKSIEHYLKFKNNGFFARFKRLFRSVENISANTLTNLDNTTKINDLNSVKPGDLIRSKGKVKNSHHVMLVHATIKEAGKVKEIKYVHSSKNYGDKNGIKYGRIIIKDNSTSLGKQEWQEGPKNYTHAGFLVDENDNGIRRLKIFN
jgi:hypothetical protein